MGAGGQVLAARAAVSEFALFGHGAGLRQGHTVQPLTPHQCRRRRMVATAAAIQALLAQAVHLGQHLFAPLRLVQARAGVGLGMSGGSGQADQQHQVLQACVHEADFRQGRDCLGHGAVRAQ